MSQGHFDGTVYFQKGDGGERFASSNLFFNSVKVNCRILYTAVSKVLHHLVEKNKKFKKIKMKLC